MCERNIDLLPLTHAQIRDQTATQAYVLTGNRTSDLLFCRVMPNELSYIHQNKMFILKLMYLEAIFCFDYLF